MIKNSHKFFANKECEYYPCHKGLEELNCLFCYCPFYQRSDCPGNPEYKEKDGLKKKSCINCTFPHDPDNYEAIMEEMKKQ